MSAIQWTDVTDNIIVVEGGGWWCRMISEGCVNCYAAKLNMSDYFGGNKLPYTGAAPKMVLREEMIDGWKRQTKPKKHFVASMTDIFGDWVPYEWAGKFLDAMIDSPSQTFQLLTKRPNIAYDYVTRWLKEPSITLDRLPPNIWIGTSVENQKRADERIPYLLKIPARVRFLSVEPMLEGIHLSLEGARNDIHWTIFGGESGPGARPCNIEWIRDGVRQCRAAGVAPFVKQLGANPFGTWPMAGNDGASGIVSLRDAGRLSAHGDLPPFKDKKGGDMSEWPEDLRIREFPTVEQIAA